MSLSLKIINYCGFSINKHIRTCLLFFLASGMILVFTAANSRGQSNSRIAVDILYNYFQSLYKLDQNLINGFKYYKPHEAVSGNEFFLEDKSSRGKITVNGKKYENVFLKFNIVTQDVILEYDYPPGGKLQIIIDDDKVSEFEIFERTFRKYEFPSTGEQFFQTISAGDLVCLIYWNKILVPIGSSLQYAYQFSEEKRKTYLLMEDQLYQFYGQKSFLKLFPDYKKEIKEYLSRYGWEIKNISDANLTRLLEFCNSIPLNGTKVVTQ